MREGGIIAYPLHLSVFIAGAMIAKITGTKGLMLVVGLWLATGFGIAYQKRKTS